MDAVEAHIAGPGHAHNGVQIGAVVIAETAGVVDDPGDLQNVFVKDANGVGIGKHQTGGIRADRRTQSVQIDAAVRAGGNVHHLEAAHGGSSRIGAVGGVRHDDLGAGRIATVGMVSLDEKNAGKLAMGAGGGLEGDGVHAEDLSQLTSQKMQRLQRALHGLDGLQGMDGGKAGQSCHLFIDLGVVFHGAGAQRIKTVIDAVDALAQLGIMPGQLIFAHMGQVQRRFPFLRKMDLRHITGRHQREPAAFTAQFKDQLHITAPPLRSQRPCPAYPWRRAR